MADDATTTDAPTAPDELERHLWTYQHRVELVGGKRGHAWRNHHGEEVYFADSPKHASPGAIYEVSCTPDGHSAGFRSADYQRQADDVDDELLARWRAEHRAVQAALDAQAAERKAKADSGDLGAMSLADASRWINNGLPNARAARLAVVLKYLGA